jgi:two-component system chemotaxis response regulator CheY
MRRRVLIVDDALFMRRMIRDILEGSKRYEVVGEAATGLEAVTRYQETCPDVVTLDVVMPGMDGIEACRQILQLDPAARVVICSALGQESMVLEAISAGARDFIVKPFAPERVLRVLDNLTTETVPA